MTHEFTSRGRIIRRYMLFQIPDAAAGALVLLLLVHNDFVSPNLAWVLFALWIGKEVALFPLVRRAYEPSGPTGTDALIGSTGVVTAPLAENGFVRVGSELWRARAASGVATPEVGATVRIESVEGYTMLVAPVDEAPETL
jgi:membrane protein implicated in regulation of membrane protease activity